MQPMTIEELAARYVAIRDEKAKLAAERKVMDDKISNAMRKIEGMLLDQLNTIGAESVRTSAGTCYKSIKTSAIVSSRDEFMPFALENPQFLESRANKTAVEEYLETTGELPPGVRVTRAVTVNIRRS